MADHTKLTALLQKEVAPALGCTAPVAVGIAAARCRAALDGEALLLEVTVSPGIYKNGWGVGIPASSEKGNSFGAALGLVCGDHTLGLEVFNHARQEDFEKARALLAENKVIITCDESQRGVYIRARLQTQSGECVTVMNTHSNIVSVSLNGVRIFQAADEKGDARPEIDGGSLSVERIISYAENVDLADIRFLLDGVKMNLALADDGLTGEFGLGSGKSFFDLMGGELVAQSPALRSKVLVAAASDARMGGSALPAMSSVGSGNQGITAILPVAVFAEQTGTGSDRLCRALAISHLVTFYVKTYIGRISSMCLCAVAASAGAAAAITWLRGGTVQTAEGAIKNILAALAGMLCDGAKNSCALKMGVAAFEAYHAAELALNGSSVGRFDGIADDSLLDMLKNLELITNATKNPIDDSVVQILNRKK